jgi:signal transduction histidine kinase
MRSRPGGLRLRLALVISAVSLAMVAGSFIAIRASTGAKLRDRIDTELREQLREFDDFALKTPVTDQAELVRRSRRFLASQRYHARSRIFLIQVPGQPPVTNQPRLVEREERGERAESPGGEAAESQGLFQAPAGLATVSGEETGKLRVFSAPVRSGGRALGTFRVADPLSPVSEAESELTNAILVVGLVALLVSAAVGAAVASRLTRPLRRMAGVASAVDAGELDHRIGRLERADEIGVLAEAFDNMLDRLDRAFRAQGDFVSDASHELRTPLTVLRGQLELLAAEEDPERRRQTIDTLLRELGHMNRLVDDMLTLASAESAEVVHPREVRLDGFLEDLERDMPLLGPRDYRVEGTRGGVLNADPERLTQVLRNLVRNAVAVTDAGDPIVVTATALDGSLEIAVRDEGPGIPPEELERVFDRFHRTDASAGRRMGGTGLGLAIARVLVEAHGGSIWAESPPGQGTTIRLRLPGYTAARPR